MRALVAISLLSGLLVATLGHPALAQSRPPPARGPETNRALLLQGENLLRNGQVAQAEGKFREVLKRDPKNLDAMVWLGDIALSRKDLGLAESYARQAQMINAGHPASHALLALVHEGRNDPARAE
ncbi:MAG: hypothetical protein DME10_28205, partial [Candidatus Rokuibacteriota bacterium]